MLVDVEREEENTPHVSDFGDLIVLLCKRVSERYENKERLNLKNKSEEFLN